MLSFKDFTVVDYTQTGDEMLAYKAQKRHRGVVGEDVSEDPCWDSHKQVGMKKKGNKMVPNCVPKNEESETSEKLTLQGRRALARAMKRNKAKVKLGRKRAMQKTANQDALMNRATKQARNQLFRKFSKGVDRGDMSPARRAEIEKKVAKMSGRVKAIARKLVPSVRRLDKERRSSKGSK